MTTPDMAPALRAITERVLSDIDNFKHNPRALFEPTIEELLAQMALLGMPVEALVPRSCEICDRDQEADPAMVLARWRDLDFCTDCLTDGPPQADYREQLALWEEKFLPITRCQYCQCRTQTAQDPQGPDGGCARCVRERWQTQAYLWDQIQTTLLADHRSTLARLGRDYRRATPPALERGFLDAQHTPGR